MTEPAASARTEIMTLTGSLHANPLIRVSASGQPDPVTAAIARHITESGSVFVELPDGPADGPSPPGGLFENPQAERPSPKMSGQPSASVRDVVAKLIFGSILDQHRARGQLPHAGAGTVSAIRDGFAGASPRHGW
jgi:hypothetical protein